SLKRVVDRRRLKGIPKSALRRVARPSEVARAIAGRIGTRRSAVDMMYRTKERFDSAAARALASHQTTTVIALYAAAQTTFEVAQKRGTRTVLHFVNSHPRVHNALLERAGAPSYSTEFIPESVVRRVETELRLADLILVP